MSERNPPFVRLIVVQINQNKGKAPKEPGYHSVMFYLVLGLGSGCYSPVGNSARQDVRTIVLPSYC